MKRLEELYTEMKREIPFVVNEELKPYILELAQVYAREVAQASLQKAAENSILKLTFSSGKIATSSTWRMPDGELIELQKSSITNEDNITLL
ncbi:hypothetical protein HZQ56_14310 [Elizabethkingia anophelis]|uniref:hypothetical protein n=1 Tax=Elizabethkingia anophelis TaxID=1117645 RepID=UPI0021A434A6|nr:hypothetical protein [Elizabethkingia anophelis]MCT3874355.1 hypothetical protein [Elizabethkingia anophelis]